MKRGATLFVLIASLVSACTALSGLDADYQLEGSSAVQNNTDGGDAGNDAVPDSAGPHTDGSGGPDSNTTCTGSSCAVPCGAVACRSCREVKQALPSTLSGVQVIEGKAGAPITVYCDMTETMAGGGWTLVGRSTNGGTSATFGWHSSDGSPTDDSKPYSLSVDLLSFEPTEMLFGSSGASGGKAWGANVYQVTLPDNFVSKNTDTAVPISLSKVKGTCGGGAMHSYAGYTSRTDVFFFRDQNSDSERFGLFPKGWFANSGTSCEYASEINGAQGMLFVR